MSEEKKTIKISMEDAKNFFDNVYKSNINERISKLSSDDQVSLNNNSLALKQFGYRQLADDFLIVSKERNLKLDEKVKYLSLSQDTFLIWTDSMYLNANKKFSYNPVTFNDATVLKMSAMVLKDTISKYIEEKNITDFSKQDLEDLIEISKLKIKNNGTIHSEISFDNKLEQKQPSKKNTIKP